MRTKTELESVCPDTWSKPTRTYRTTVYILNSSFAPQGLLGQSRNTAVYVFSCFWHLPHHDHTTQTFPAFSTKQSLPAMPKNNDLTIMATLSELTLVRQARRLKQRKTDIVRTFDSATVVMHRGFMNCVVWIVER